VKLLAIETAGDACSCAVLGGAESYERHLMAPRRHAELILSMVRDLLDESHLALEDLDALAFGRGPGSFTGVRVAAGVVQGLAFGAELPVVPVSSLQALAQGALRETGSERVLAAFDARMGEVYWGAYEAGDDGLMIARVEDCVAAPDAVPVPSVGAWLGVGEGWRSYAEALVARVGDRLAGYQAEHTARALDVAMLARAGYARGESVSASEALPVYVRNQVARKRGA
jgi:tRNA threonylcarbamoyladenosine biosynthesis protein TsaB